MIIQVCPGALSQPLQPAKVEPVLAVAVALAAEPLGRMTPQLAEQVIPDGETITLPLPVPIKSTVRSGPEPPVLVPVKQITFACMFEVTIAPDDERFPILWFVFTVAEIRVPPQAPPVAVIIPVESTDTMSGVFEAHVTWLVISLVTGG